ncbi:MAG: alpha/beta hydrolase [Verrucomicrobiota bacterium]
MKNLRFILTLVAFLPLAHCLHFAQAQKKAATPAEAPEGATEKKTYKTVDGTELPLYIYNPADHSPDSNSPAIVFFFGGGWKGGTPKQFQEQCKYLADRGMVAITAEYRVSSRHDVKVEDCIADAKSAIRWVRSHADELGIDPDKIAAGGGSAGGHLAAATSVIKKFDADSDDTSVSAKPNLLVLFNPALAIAPHERLSEAYNQAMSERINDRSHGPMKHASPLTNADKKQPPCIMFFGTADRLLHGAEVYRDVSVEAGNDCEIVLYPDQGHGFFNHGRNENKFYDLTVAETDKFLTKHGYLTKD